MKLRIRKFKPIDMPRRMTSAFAFLKVGQGCFYRGIINTPGNDRSYTIVYDCGTSPFIAGHTFALNREINEFRDLSIYDGKEKVIDILFISHLDYDHVSGIERLLREFTVKRVVLPDISPEILNYALLSFEGADEGNLEAMPLEEYARFLESPERYIIALSDGTEVYLVSDQPTDGYRENPDDLNNADGIYALGTPTDDGEKADIASRKIKHYKNDLQFIIKSAWEFTVFAKLADPSKIDQLRQGLKHILGVPTDGELSQAELKKLLSVHRRKAKECYRKCFTDINAYGLVLYHEPSSPIGNKNGYICIFATELEISSSGKNAGTLLMGDCSLHPSNNPVGFTYHFMRKIEKTHVFQVPHHGSPKNWDFVAYNGMFQKSLPVNICNFGFGNKFGHPGHQVMEDLFPDIILASQFNSINYNLIEILDS